MILPNNFDFTQSNLQDFLDCPYRFYLRYILRTKWPALLVDSAIDFELRAQAGARFHRMVQQYLLGVPEALIQDLAEADPVPEIAVWWDNFCSFIPAVLSGRQLVETVLSTELAECRLVAKYDLILIQDQNRVVIFDWKTSKKKIRKDWLIKKIQTRLYRFILTQAGSILKTPKIEPAQVTMNYWFATHPEALISLPYDQIAYESDIQFFTGLIQEIRNKDEGDFIKTKDTRKCRYCVYRSHCDRGTQAGDLEAFDDIDMEPVLNELDIEFDNIAEIEF
ncbi:MAG: PD-(D/E)XK nuclease family protein [Chloroflexota bacterium]|nr:PD-(D/E)XK nuclease family protein [Chloroflexota bacterium]